MRRQFSGGKHSQCKLGLLAAGLRTLELDQNGQAIAGFSFCPDEAQGYSFYSSRCKLVGGGETEGRKDKQTHKKPSMLNLKKKHRTVVTFILYWLIPNA